MTDFAGIVAMHPPFDNISYHFHSHFRTMAHRGPIVGPARCPRNDEENPMPKFVIEREIPGAGKLSPAELKAVSQKSCGVLSNLGPAVQWVHSYVTADRIYCVYQAADESLVRRHAELGGFPANRISRVMSVIDPATAE
jgi:hypothetical protein